MSGKGQRFGTVPTRPQIPRLAAQELGTALVPPVGSKKIPWGGLVALTWSPKCPGSLQSPASSGLC